MTRNVTRIAIAATTRLRPRLLANLMQSLQALDVPQGAELCFVFVENDASFSISDVVDDFHKRSGWPATAVHEPQLGGSYAHNAALDMARTQGADWLAIVEDHAQVRHDWLRVLWSQARERGAHMAGGPVIPVAPSTGCSDDQAHILSYYERAAAVSDARKVAAMQAGRQFDITTKNWIADLAALDKAGLRFDPAVIAIGDEHADLSRRAHAAGLKLTWVQSAIVTEEIPAERLRTGYVLSRARAQSITKHQLALAENAGLAKGAAVAQIISKGVAGAIWIAISPMAGSYSYYRGVRALGIAQGFWAGLRGGDQASYSSVTGS